MRGAQRLRACARERGLRERDRARRAARHTQAITYACQRYMNYLGDGARSGFLLGDDAGIGNRQIAGLLMETVWRGCAAPSRGHWRARMRHSALGTQCLQEADLPARWGGSSGRRPCL